MKSGKGNAWGELRPLRKEMPEGLERQGRGIWGNNRGEGGLMMDRIWDEVSRAVKSGNRFNTYGINLRLVKDNSNDVIQNEKGSPACLLLSS